MADREDTQPRTTMAKFGAETYRLTLDGEEKVRVAIEDVDQENRFVAHGRNQAGTLERKVRAAIPGEELYLEERETADDEWEQLGEVTFAEQL